MKQDLKAIRQKIKRFTGRVEQFNQNRLFVNNQRQFYRNLQGGKNENGEAPERGATRELWQTIWSEPVEHNRNAVWIEKVKEKMEHVENQTDLDITAEDVKQALSKVPNWNSLDLMGSKGSG